MKSKHCLLLVLPALLLSVGCKLQIDVPAGGRVVSESGAYACDAGESCTIDVVDAFFNETFIAEPASGYAFGGWEKAERSLCGGARQRDLPCSLSTQGFGEFEVLMAVLESDEVFYLLPTFTSLTVEAFIPEDFIGQQFRVAEDGLEITYRFNADGSYSKRSPPLFATGSWEFQLDNQVIAYTELAETNTPGLIGWAVFDRYDAPFAAYIVCYITDQQVTSAGQAVDVCSNGATGGIEKPDSLRFSPVE